MNNLADAINKSGHKAVIITTGGGSGIFPMLLERGGGSATLLSGIIPYTEEETYSILGGKPDKIVSEQTARSLAMAAYMKGLKLNKTTDPIIGIGCTCALQKVPTEREGRNHYIYLAGQTGDKSISLSWEIKMNVTDKVNINPETQRIWEESLVNRFILTLLGELCGIKTQSFNLYEGAVRKEVQSELFGYVLEGSLNKVCFKDGKNYGAWGEGPYILFPGSFNPLHEGHKELTDFVTTMTDTLVDYEISMFNVDKPPLDFITLDERIKQFSGMSRVFITNAPTFVDKSNLFPGADFIVGYDTAVRIMDPKYAGPVDKVVETFIKNETYFYVFPRPSKQTLSEESLGEAVKELETLRSLPHEYVTEPMQHRHVSSSEIRRKNNG